MVDLNVAITNTGVDTTIEKLQKLLSTNKNTATAFVRLAAESKAAAGTITQIASAAASAGARLQNWDKTLTETGSGARSLAAANEVLAKSYTDIALRNIGATPAERLAAAGGGSLAAGKASAAAIQAQREAFNADPVRDYMAVLAQETAAEQRRVRALQEQATASREAARAAAELVDAQAGRSGAQQGLQRAREDYANQARGISQVESATIQLARAEQDLAAAQANVTASQQRNRNNGRFAKEDAQYVRGQTQALEQEENALRGVIAAQEQLTRATQQTASASSASDTSGINSNLGSFAYLQIASAANRAADAIRDFGATSISASAELERSFADVQRTFDPGPGPELEALKQKIIDLSLVDPISTEQIAQIATLGNQLGVSAANIESFTQTIAEYSAVSGESADSAATAFGKIGNLTGLSAAQYSNLGSAIEYVARTSVSTEAGIQRTSQEITAIAAGAGFSAEAIVGLSGTLASLAIPPERARGSLSLYFGALNKAVSEGGPKLSAFAELTGLTTSKLSELVNANKGEEVFTKFVAGLGDLNNVAKTTALRELGLSTIRVDQTMRALSQNVPLLTSSLAGSAKAFKDNVELGNQYNVIQKTLSSQWVEFQSAVQNAAAGLGDTFNTEQIKGFLSMLTKLVAGFRNFAQTPFGQGFLTIAAAMAAVTFVMATLIGGLALLAAGMKLVPWALTGLGAKEANNGFVQFLAGLLGVNLQVKETAAGQEVLASTFSQVAARSEAASIALKQYQFTLGGLVLSEAQAAEESLLLDASLAATAASSGAATAGLTAMKFALIATGVGAAVVLIGSLIAAYNEFGGAVKSAKDEAKNFFEGQDTTSLADNFKEDQLTYLQTGKSISMMTAHVKESSTEAKEWVASLEKGAGAQVVLNKNTADTTNTVRNQTEAFGSATQNGLKTLLANNKNIQSLFKDSASNAAAASSGFDSTGFLQAIVGDPTEGGKQYMDAFVSGLTSQTGFSNEEVRHILDQFNSGMDAEDVRTANNIANSNKYVESIGRLAPAYKIAQEAVIATGSEIQKAADSAATATSIQDALAGATGDTAAAFDGAADSVGAYQDAIQVGLGKFGDFATQIKALNEAAKAAAKADPNNSSKNPVAPKAISGKDFSASLAGTNKAAVDFYQGIAKIAKQGATSFATQIASVGPDGAGILADSLKMTGHAKAILEENSRFAAFLVSDEFKTALSASMSTSNAAYAKIFSAPLAEGGGLKGVKEYIAAQVAGTGTEFEKQWDIHHPDLSLNVNIGKPNADEIRLFKDELAGKIKVSSPVVVPFKPGAFKTYTDSASGKSITLPGRLDPKSLAASLKAWRQDENQTPEEIEARINTRGFNGDISAWINAHGPIQVYADLTPTASSVARLHSLFSGNGTPDGKPKGSPAFASGGMLQGPGTGTSDSLWARVSRGEYISTAAATSFWGADFMDSLNKRMLPTSFVNMLGAAANSGNSGPSHVAHVSVQQINPLTRDPLHQLREDSEKIAAGIWG